MAERSEVLRVQNDALLNEYHQLIAAQVRRINEAVAVLDQERSNLVAERAHLLKYLPQPEQEPMEDRQVRRLGEQKNALSQEVPKFIQKGPANG